MPLSEAIQSTQGIAKKIAYILLNLLINEFNILISNISIKYIKIQNIYYLLIRIRNFPIFDSIFNIVLYKT